MKAIFIILSLAVLSVCFGQIDSADQPVTAVIRQSLKPIDTSINIAPVHKAFTLKRGQAIRGRFSGSALDTVYLRIIDAKPKPLASGDTLKVDSIQVVVTMTVTKVWGLRTITGLIEPPQDTTIILSVPRP